MKEILTAVFLLLGYSATAQLPAGYRVYYKFDNNYADSSGNNYHAAGTNTTFTADRHARPNGACHFNGTNALVTSPYLPANINGYTFGVWMKNDFSKGASNSHTVASYRGSITADNPSITLDYTRKDGWYTGGYNNDHVWHARNLAHNNNGQWIHVVLTWKGNGTFDSSQFKLYLNGVLKSCPGHYYNKYNHIIPSAPFTAVMPLLIGGFLGLNYYAGDMDDVIIYDRALSHDEVSQLYEYKDPSYNPEDDTSTSISANTKMHINVYPNPASDIMYVTGNNTGTLMNISMINTLGQVVYQQNSVTMYNNMPSEINVAHLPEGIYMLHVWQGSEQRVFKCRIAR